jgi:putative membrane protein
MAAAMYAVPAIAQAPAAAKPHQSGAAKTHSGVSATDQAFAKEAAIGGMAEVELGTLAKEKASNPDVKQFGERMVTEHGSANDELKQWAQQKNVTLPTDLDAQHKATKDRLSKLSGDAFDKAYMRDMVSDHVKDVAAFKHEAASGKDADLKAWAGKTLPTLQDHLKSTREINAEVTGSATHAKKPSKQ